MKRILHKFIFIAIIGCNDQANSTSNTQFISNPEEQNSIFSSLVDLVDRRYISKMEKDSLSFLLLPVEASCPSCRNKTIDSILNHLEELSDHQIIIITASKGKKTMSHYFRIRGGELPLKRNFFFDSSNRAFNSKLFKDNPAIYFTADRKAYKQIYTLPITIKQDLHNFFSK